MTNNMDKERITATYNKELEFIYKGLEHVGMGFEIMLKVITAPFVLEVKLLNSLDSYLHNKDYIKYDTHYNEIIIEREEN